MSAVDVMKWCHNSISSMSKVPAVCWIVGMVESMMAIEFDVRMSEMVSGVAIRFWMDAFRLGFK